MRFGMLPMGDISAEPSMEEILSSIKRIIAEEGDGVPARQRRGARPIQPVALAIDESEPEDDEVLELSDPMPMAERPRTARPAPEPAAAPAPVERAPEPPRAAPAAVLPDEPAPRLVSRETAAATRAPLEALTRLMVKPEAGSDGTLEGLVREMLRPMLREWMDANLPDMVEDMVAREIARITGEG